jgi:hypothetical protein
MKVLTEVWIVKRYSDCEKNSRIKKLENVTTTVSLDNIRVDY